MLKPTFEIRNRAARDYYTILLPHRATSKAGRAGGVGMKVQRPRS